MSEIRDQILALLARRPDLSGPQIGSYTSLAAGTVRHWLDGSERYSKAVDNQFARVLQQIDAGEILQPGQHAVTLMDADYQTAPRRSRNRDFYVTKTVQMVRTVLRYCSDNALIGVITGDYGVGKTQALTEWFGGEGRNVEHLVFEFHVYVASGVSEFMSALARALGVEVGSGRMYGARNFEAVCAELLERPRLLVFDQAEIAQPLVLQAIRQVWDRTRGVGVGVVLLASPLLLTKLQGARIRDLGALTSRVAVWCPLKGLDKDQAASIIRDEGVASIEPDALDLLVRASKGSMRRLMAVTDMLVQKHNGKPVTIRTIEGVAARLWGMQVQGGADRGGL